MCMNTYEDVLKTLHQLFDELFQEYRSKPQVNAVLLDKRYCVISEVESLLISKLTYQIYSRLELDKSTFPIFENKACLSKLFLMSGGNKQNLYRLLCDVFLASNSLPLKESIVDSVIVTARSYAARGITTSQYKMLATIYHNPLLLCDTISDYQKLVENRWVFCYRCEKADYWIVNPLILGTSQFQEIKMADTSLE